MKGNHTSYGFFLLFRSPTIALKGIMALRSDATRLGLQNRIGVHLDEYEAGGEELTGTTVHFAARVMNKAKRDEILTFQIVKNSR
jgi:class 3 adenylate cyclase